VRKQFWSDINVPTAPPVVRLHDIEVLRDREIVDGNNLDLGYWGLV